MRVSPCLCDSVASPAVTKSRMRTVLDMIKFEHSIFALPFALVGALLAARAGGGLPSWRQILWIVVAMVGARSAAMTMNRIADVEYDRRNPRTANRALPASRLSLGFAWAFTFAASAVLVLAAWQLNRLALELSPVALALLFLYSYTKRFTAWSHFVLGFCLGISPAAAWIAIRGSLDGRILILSAAVTLWVGGLRRALRLPGRGIRPRRRAALDSKKIRHRAGALDRARDARRDGRAGDLAGLDLPSRMACVGWNRRSRRPFGLRTFAREAQRPEQNECCVFHREWLY